MSVTEEHAVPLSPSSKKRKKRLQKSAAEPSETADSAADGDTQALQSTKTNSDSVAVRLKKRKKRKLETGDGYNAAKQTAKNDGVSVNTISVNDNVDSVPLRMKKRKVAQPESIDKRNNESDECDLKPHKRVSFNDTIHSAPLHVKKRKKLKPELADVKKHPPPKSILKHTEFTNGPDPKKRKYKNKKKQRKIQFKAKNNVPTQNTTISVSKQERAIAFLETWKNDKSNWKFEKLTQTWLLKNMLDGSKVPEKSFLLLLEYIMSIEGAAKDFAAQTCETAINKMEQKSLSEEKDEALEYSYNRARSLLQCLQE